MGWPTLKITRLRHRASCILISGPISLQFILLSQFHLFFRFLSSATATVTAVAVKASQFPSAMFINLHLHSCLNILQNESGLFLCFPSFYLISVMLNTKSDQWTKLFHLSVHKRMCYWQVTIEKNGAGDKRTIGVNTSLRSVCGGYLYVISPWVPFPPWAYLSEDRYSSL